MDETLRLKFDLQQCIANNMDLHATYGSLLFEGDYLEYIQSLGFFETLSIEPKDNKLLYKGKLAKDLLSQLDENTINIVKKLSLETQMLDIAKQKIEQNKSPIDKLSEKLYDLVECHNAILETYNKDKIYKKASKEDISKVKKIQKKLKKYGIATKYSLSKEYLSLEANFNSLTLNKIQLRLIEDIVFDDIFDMFFICPVYNEFNEADDNVYGVRLFFAINLMEGV